MSDNISIDDLLALVSPDLVRKYEEINLKGYDDFDPPSGETMKMVNEEYKISKTLASRANRESCKLFSAAIVFMIIGAISVLFTKLTIVSSTFLLIGALFMWRSNRWNNVTSKAEGSGNNNARPLKDFRIVIGALKSPVGRTMDEYTEKSVRDNFVTHAVRILDTERSFDEVRLQKKRMTYNILHYGNCLEKFQADFQTASIILKAKFGLEFDNTDLFAEAKQHLSRSNQ